MEALLKVMFNTIIIISYKYRITAVRVETNIISSNAAIKLVVMYTVTVCQELQNILFIGTCNIIQYNKPQ